MASSASSRASKQGGEDGELGDEPGQRRQAHQAEKNDRRRHGQSRRAAHQAGVVVDRLAVDGVAEEGDRGEGAEIHEQVDAQVDQQRGHGGLRRRRHCPAQPARRRRPRASSCSRHARSSSRPADASCSSARRRPGCRRCRSRRPTSRSARRCTAVPGPWPPGCRNRRRGEEHGQPGQQPRAGGLRGHGEESGRLRPGPPRKRPAPRNGTARRKA